HVGFFQSPASILIYPGPGLRAGRSPARYFHEEDRRIMKRERWIALWLGTAMAALGMTALLAPGFGAIQSNKPAQAFKIEDLSWISGDWETAPGRGQIDEHWTTVAGGSMIGMSRTVAGGKTVFFEYLRIEARGADIYYVAHPKARTPGTDFKLVRLAG